MRTEHLYLTKYPIDKEAKKLIVGTIHPHNEKDFDIPFFYGNRKSLWKIFSEAFPAELNGNPDLSDIQTFLKNRQISISDTIAICERKNPTALDQDLIPIKLNLSLIDDIRSSDIAEIYFTSGFQKNNAFKLFYVDILGFKLTKEIRTQKTILLDEKVFGRPVKLTVLISPSGASNVGVSKSKIYLDQIDKYKNLKTPVHKFKVDYYRQMFSEY